MKYKLGDVIHFKQGYPIECKNRFPILRVAPYDRSKDPIPHKFSNSGFVVGYRNVIMSEYKYIICYGDSNEPEGSYAAGKWEVVYLVTCNPWQKPFIVRTFDIMRKD